MTLDTRVEGSPDSRVYAASFARVWDTIHAEVDARRGWTMVHSDEELGLLTVICRTFPPWETDHLSIWVRLDENALTRVDTRAFRRAGFAIPRRYWRRVRTLVSSLDRRLGYDIRIRD